MKVFLFFIFLSLSLNAMEQEPLVEQGTANLPDVEALKEALADGAANLTWNKKVNRGTLILTLLWLAWGVIDAEVGITPLGVIETAIGLGLAVGTSISFIPTANFAQTLERLERIVKRGDIEMSTVS